MKISKLSLLLAGIFLTTAANANIVINSSGVKGDVCEQVTGHWVGSGKAVVFGIINCVYDGATDIQSSQPGELTLANLTLNLRSRESSPLCPAHEVLNLPGQCHNGKILIHDDAANLDGELTDSGTRAHASGTVTFEVPILGRISPKVNIDLHK